MNGSFNTKIYCPLKMKAMEFKTYMLFTCDLKIAKEEVERAEGQVIVDLTDKVFLANLPNQIDPVVLTHASTQKPSGMDLLSNLMVEVWIKRRPNEMQHLLEKLLPRDIPSVTTLQNIAQIV
jgi:hypothetical protein